MFDKKLYQIEWRKKNKDHIKSYSKKWYAKNKLKKNEYDKQYNLLHAHNYYLKNREKILAYNSSKEVIQNQKEKYKTDINYRIKHNL